MFGISVGARKPCWAAPAFSEVQFPEERIKYALPDMSQQESEIMPHYISLVNWTEQGVRNVKESPKRADAANAMASKLGAKMDIFYTMGKYDHIEGVDRGGSDKGHREAPVDSDADPRRRPWNRTGEGSVGRGSKLRPR